MLARLFLAAVGVLYLTLAVWCSIDSSGTSELVGFTLLPGSGQSEFLTVYGGLEMALGIIFLWPLYRREHTDCSLWVCLVLHGCLVVFRSIGFVSFDEFTTMTYKLAAGEWAIFGTTLAIYWRRRS